MQGRKENEERMRERIIYLLKDRPRYMTNFYNSMVVSEKSYTTQHVYIRNVLNFLDYLYEVERYNVDYPNCFKHVKMSEINGYIIKLECGDSSKANKIYAIKLFFKFLLDNEYINVDPTANINAPKDKEEHKIVSLSKEDIQKVKENIFSEQGHNKSGRKQKQFMNRDWAIFSVGISLGLRVTTMSEINVSDINFETNELTVTEKGNKTKTIKMGQNLIDIINLWLDDRKKILNKIGIESDVLFISKLGKRMCRDSFAKVISKNTYNIDKHITPDILRSTFCNIVYDITGDLYLTSLAMGHSNIQNTLKHLNIDIINTDDTIISVDNFIFNN